ncbi:DNA topoisomerase III [Bacillus solimangrovi]|uniref:DNA topoisomerase n=1 Tax=Bacillus solimangrovi TaxID=1305675 RepID=A0A1E5LFA4_9BACI|nr:DNA topoisomerase III [Bacillus solimangrovi]OEH92759.1 DNA topoisomerase III [Bacillus solimangrovi]
MKLIIAEKPDQGLKLASPFSHERKGDYLEIKPNDFFPEGALLTWAIGHLCELVPPEQYHSQWKKWSLEQLPLLPDKFQHQVTRGKGKQFNVVKKLVQNQSVRSIIIASDAGREGEAIVRTILSLCHNKKPIERLWISSLTPNSVKNGFENLLSEEETRPIYYEALSRSCADWLVGMNASRVYTLLLQEKGISDVFSTGRVQTPTLALIEEREKEIEDFKSESFWEVVASFNIESKTYIGKWHKDNETRIKNEKEADAIAHFCENKRFEVKEVVKEKKEYNPPFLFNLSSLQATANQLFKFPPKKTLDVAQKLYVKGIISYPRSDSAFVTKEEAAGFPNILSKLSQFNEYQIYFPTTFDSIMNNKRYVNEKKVTDHYAIIPTEQVTNPSKLSGDEQKIYDLIIRRLIAAHYNNAIFNYTVIHSLVDGRATFISKGKELVEQGWRKVIYQDTKLKKNGEEDLLLPNLEQGESGVVEHTEVKDGKTQPPKRYTEGQLITLMKTVGKRLEDSELSKVLNQTEGLGTEATRAGIIDVLKARKYIEVKKNQVYVLDKGRVLIEAVGSNVLSSAEMTAKWEKRLREIGHGKASPTQFMEQAKKLTKKLIEDAKSQSQAWKFEHVDIKSIQRTSSKKKRATGKPIGNCKKCDGKVIDKGSFYGCSKYTQTNCDFTISKKILGKTISQSNVKKLLNDESTNLIKGFKKGDKVFDAKLGWSENNLSFVFN